MLFHLIFLLVALHSSYGRPSADSSKPSPIREAIQRINPELDRITLRLKELKLELHKDVLQAAVEHHQAMSNSGERILQGLSDLQGNFTGIQQIAQDSEAKECISRQREKLERLVVVASQKVAKHSAEAEGNFSQKAKELVEEADAIERNINKVIGFCIRQNNLAWQQEKLLQCLREEALEINKVVDKLYKEQGLIRVESSEFEKNLTEDEDGLLRWMQSIQKQLQECVVETSPTDYDYFDDFRTSSPKEKDGSGSEFEVTSKGLKTEDASDILDRIKRLEFLLHQLKELHENRANESLTTAIPLYISKKSEEDAKQIETASKNHRYIMYISF